MSEQGRRGLFTIGEFSRATGITVKALRLYHDERLLIPSLVDDHSGYRYYESSLIDRARAIVYMRGLEFPLDQIKEILLNAEDDEQILRAMEAHKSAIEQRIRHLRAVVRSLNQFISEERQAKAMSQTTYEVQEKTVGPMLIAGIRMKGRYDECGKGFGKILRSFGRQTAGAPMMLHFDAEYKENDADFEACIPVKQGRQVNGIDVRQIPGGRCVTLIHQGPYDQLGPSYARILKYVKEKGYAVISPTREVYLKGPGMIFRGNPRKYLTEIQFPIGNAPAAAG